MSFMTRVLSHKQDRLEQNGSNVKSLLMFNKRKSSLILSDYGGAPPDADLNPAFYFSVY